MNFKEFLNEVEPWLTSYHDNDLKNILVTFTGIRNWSLSNSETAKAPALFNTITNSIEFNPILIASRLFELRKELKIVDNKDKFIKNIQSHLYVITKHIKTFLLLHEIGHWLYSATPKDFIPLMKKHCSNIPSELSMYLLNVVEDSVIQRLFMLDFRGTFYRQCFDIGICCFQGAEAVKTYVANSEEQNWSIRTKLFYFIIRAYNLHNSEVQAMFNIPDKIGWRDDTVQAFDQAITTIDSIDRAKYVFETLAPLVFRDLVEEIDENNSESTSSNDSLLNQDKLYTSKDSSQASSNSNEDNNSFQEESQDTSSEGNSNSNSKPSTTSTNNQSSDSNSDESISSVESAPEVVPIEPTEKTIKDQIVDACNYLNKSINAHSDPNKVSETPKLKKQINPLAVSCGIKDHTNLRSDLNKFSSMNTLTLNIYGNAIGVLDKIFTMSNDVLRGLDQGDLDEDELYTYYTEKNLNIYKEDHKVKQDKKVVVYFILDNSGSMSGPRFDYSSAAFIGLIHAFEDIQIKCCFLTFGDDCRLIKKFEDSTSFLGADSPLQYMVDKYVSNLESDTNLYPALDFVVNDEIFNDSDPDLCKVVIVATDGRTNKESACAYLAEQISSEALMFAIGLDMSNHLDYLERVMPGSIVRNYDGKTIATHLPEDIYNEIINRFLLY